ncbi:MAG: lytB 1 [Firmicutes bacterium]|nr:lytB 1 [Bacillota bacterium]
MRNKHKVNFTVIAAFILVIVAGAFTLLRTPAPKLLPEEQFSLPSQPQPQVEPVPGLSQFDTTKYSREPEIEVWLADKQERKRMLLEKYLEGVVAKEMDPAWPLEALRAQAIVSRTLTLNAIEAGTIRKIHNTDVSTDKEELQAYAPEKVNNTIRAAVQSTRGQIILYAGSLVNAIYSASNGQISATKEEGFPREIPYPTPYFQSVADDSYKYTPPDIQEWTVKIPGGEVASAIGYDGNPGDISILEKGPSGRIMYIGVGDKKIYGADFRKAMGFDRLKSTLITEMKYDGSNFTFTGKGWGNGLGLCQWGAYTYALAGVVAEDILKHYYIGIQIHKLWN